MAQPAGQEDQNHGFGVLPGSSPGPVRLARVHPFGHDPTCKQVREPQSQEAGKTHLEELATVDVGRIAVAKLHQVSSSRSTVRNRVA